MIQLSRSGVGALCLLKQSLSRLYHCCCFWRKLTEVTVKIYKSLRINCANVCRVQDYRRLQPPPLLPDPSTTHSCESSRATKTPLRKRPDGEQMTARSKGLMQRVSGFQRAIPLKHRLCTPSTPRHRRARQIDFRIRVSSSRRKCVSTSKSTRRLLQSMYPLSTKRCARRAHPTYGRKSTAGTCHHGSQERRPP